MHQPTTSTSINKWRIQLKSQQNTTTVDVTVMQSLVPLLTKTSQLEQKQTNCDNLISHFYVKALF